MTQLLRTVLDFLYSDLSEPKIPNGLMNSMHECVYVHFLLSNLRQNVQPIPKCDAMIKYLYVKIAFTRTLSSQEFSNILDDMKKGMGRPVTRIGQETFPFEWGLWNLVRGFWVNRYNILEFLYITTKYSKELIFRERVVYSESFRVLKIGI